MNTNFQKYLKYKSKYLDLKNELQLQVGGSRSLYGGATKIVNLEEDLKNSTDLSFDDFILDMISKYSIDQDDVPNEQNSVFIKLKEGYLNDLITAKEKLVLSQELGTINTSLADLTRDKATADNNIAQLELEIRDLNQELSDNQTLLTTISNNNKKCNIDLVNVKKDFTDCETKLAAAEAAANKAVAAASTASATASPKALTAAEAAVKKLEQDLVTLRQELSECTSKLSTALAAKATPPVILSTKTSPKTSGPTGTSRAHSSPNALVIPTPALETSVKPALETSVKPAPEISITDKNLEKILENANYSNPQSWIPKEITVKMQFITYVKKHIEIFKHKSINLNDIQKYLINKHPGGNFKLMDIKQLQKMMTEAV